MSEEMGVILASHGDFAKEARNSLEMIMGEQGNMETVSLYYGEDLGAMIDKMETSSERLDTKEGLIIICDIFGGTPSNAAAALLLKRKEERIMAYAGLNLPVLLEIVSARKEGFTEVIAKINEVSSNTWVELKNKKKEDESEVDL